LKSSDDYSRILETAAREGMQTEYAYRRVEELPSIFTPVPPINWLVDVLIAEASVNLLTAQSGHGKSWVAYALAGTISSGTPFLGLPVQQRKALYCDGENPQSMVQERLKHLGISENEHLRVWGLWCKENPPAPDDSRLYDFAKRHKPLMIWDSLIEFSNGVNEQSASEVRPMMRKYRTMATAGATVIVLHHSGKSDNSQEYRGSSDIKAAVDSAFLLVNNKPTEKLSELILKPFTTRLCPLPTLNMQYQKGSGL
jgi:RecA-family ATPase